MLLRTEPDIDPAVFALQMLALLTHTDPGMFSTLPGSSGYTEFEHNSNVKRIADLEYIIDSQFMTPLYRTAIAEKLFISTRQLERICKKRFGKTFREQVKERRMNAAVQML